MERSNISTIWVPPPSDRAPDSSPEPAHVSSEIHQQDRKGPRRELISHTYGNRGHQACGSYIPRDTGPSAQPAAHRLCYCLRYARCAYPDGYEEISSVVLETRGEEIVARPANNSVKKHLRPSNWRRCLQARHVCFPPP